MPPPSETCGAACPIFGEKALLPRLLSIGEKVR